MNITKPIAPDTLIERLRNAANGVGDLKSPQGDFGLCDDAADALEANNRQLQLCREALRNLRNEIAATEEHGDGAAEEFCPICQAIEQADKVIASIEGVGE